VKNAEVPPGGEGRENGRGGLSDYKTLGYVSTDFERAGNRTVEYAANDWALALCAKKLGKEEAYRRYYQRAANWQNLWKPETSHGASGFIMPRKANGEWDETYRDPTWKHYTDIPPRRLGVTKRDSLGEGFLSEKTFDMETEGSWPNFFYESHSWEYSFYVPHDVKALIQHCGGQEQFIARLDTFFKKGFYNIGNEPGFLTPCLYIYAGRHDKTAMMVKNLRETHFTNQPGGLPGNDDSGAMSAWYVFHSLGFYPNAGQDVYLITTPAFEKSVVSLGKGKTFEIEAKNLSAKNMHVEKAELNGKPWDKAWFRHSDIKEGGKLILYMGKKPTGWGTRDLPPSRSDMPDRN
ncbi:MAG: glycoside hydrolase family 92 protein, partial [Cyclobacteriaceae bacterium]|nr:glycoside hydrolase family 92 protein [Cyclobacteriaceae bacterium]